MEALKSEYVGWEITEIIINRRQKHIDSTFYSGDHKNNLYNHNSNLERFIKNVILIWR